MDAAQETPTPVGAPPPSAVTKPKDRSYAGEAPLTDEEIARVCHDANRIYCVIHGDISQAPWPTAAPWQKDSAIAGVKAVRANPEQTSAQNHEAWLEDKLAHGWKYGPVKDAEKKEHPCMVAYDQLPPSQRRKDALFVAIVRALAQ